MFMIYFHAKFCVSVASILYSSPKDLKMKKNYAVAVTLLIYFLQRVATDVLRIFLKSISIQHFRSKEQGKC